MQKQFVLVLCGGLLGAAMVAWVQPATTAGATLLVVFALLLVQAAWALAQVVARRPRPPGGPLTVVVLAALAAMAAGPAKAQGASFELLNGSDLAIAQVYVSRTGSSQWGDALLGAGVLAARSRAQIALGSRDGCVLDIRITYENGRSDERRGFDACREHELRFGAAATARRPAEHGAMNFSSERPPQNPTVERFGLRLPLTRGLTDQGSSIMPDAPQRLGQMRSAMAPPHRLTPAAVFLPPESIPPAGVGAYGIMALRAQPTDASTGRLTMACKAFLASLPPQESLPTSIAVADQMLTIWPLLSSGLAEAECGSCPHLLEHYALFAGQAAIADAEVAAGALHGAGPFLIGWSPSNKRGVPDAVVLVVDMSGLQTQERFDDAFRFWQEKVIGDPQLWRNGFDAERLRLSVKDFVDRYGTAIQSAVKLWGG